MIDLGSRSTWGPGPSRSGLRGQKYDPPPTKTYLPYNFCFIKFLPSLMVEAVHALQTLLRAPLTSRVGVVGPNLANNLSDIKIYSYAKFHQDRSDSLDFYRVQIYIFCALYIRLAEVPSVARDQM